MILPTHLQQKPSEIYFEWKRRVLLGKLNKETDLEWDELVEVLGETCSGDHLRKTAYGIREFQEYLDEVKESNIADSDVLNELELKKLELLEERKKLQTIRVDYNKIARDKARRELIYEHVKDSIERLPAPDFEIIPKKINKGKREGVVSFGDVHWGKIFESEHNSYSPEIFEERMQELANNIIHYLGDEFDHIHIINMADSIEGMSLRISQLQTLKVGYIDQTISFAKYYSKWLNELSKHFKITLHHIPSSNHSEVRPFGSNRGEFPAEDLEKVIIHYVHDTLENNDRINIPIYTKGIVHIEIAGYNVVMAHGHQLRMNKNIIRDLSAHKRIFFDYLYIAHFHHSDNLTVNEGATNNVEIIKIPSVMGSDEYSDSLLTGAKAGFNISIFEEGKGRPTKHDPILN